MVKTRHETGENAVEIDTDGTDTYVTYTSGCAEPLYVGGNFSDAAESLEMEEDTFNALIMSDDEWSE